MSSGGPVRVSTHRKNFVVKFVFLRFTFVPHKQVLRKPHASDAEHEARRERKREKPHVDNFLGIQLHPDVSIVYARYAKLESLQTHVAVSSACMVLHMMRGMHRIIRGQESFQYQYQKSLQNFERRVPFFNLSKHTAVHAPHHGGRSRAAKWRHGHHAYRKLLSLSSRKSRRHDIGSNTQRDDFE